MKLVTIGCIAILGLSAAGCGGSAATPSATPTTHAAVPTDTATPAVPTDTATPAGPTGSISGSLENAPGDPNATLIRIIAHEMNTGAIAIVEIPIDQTTYVISGLPAGVYTISAGYEPNGIMGSYTSADITQAITSSEQLTCQNAITKITLKPEKFDFEGADISCWGGDYFYLLTPNP